MDKLLSSLNTLKERSRKEAETERHPLEQHLALLEKEAGSTSDASVKSAIEVKHNQIESVGLWYESVERHIDTLAAVAARNQSLLQAFPGIETQLAAMTDSCTNALSLSFGILGENADQLRLIDEKVRVIENSLSPQAVANVDGGYNNEVIAQARALVSTCRREMQISDMDRMLGRLTFTIPTIEKLLAVKPVDKIDDKPTPDETDNRPDQTIVHDCNELKRQVTSLVKTLSGNADRYNCRKTVEAARKMLSSAVNSDRQTLEDLESHRHRLKSVFYEFSNEEDEFRRLYDKVMKSYTICWTDQCAGLQHDMESFLGDIGISQSADFSLSDFNSRFNKIKANKKNDIAAYCNANKKLMKKNGGKYRQRLTDEIENKRVSTQDFADWKKSVKKEASGGFWKKVWKVLKVILYIFGIVFVTAFFIMKATANNNNNSNNSNNR